MNYQKNKKFAPVTRIVSLVLTLLFVANPVSVVFAQKRSAAPVAKQNKSQVEIARAAAVSDGQNGTLIEWQTSYESGSLGYNVYRVVNGNQTKINKNLIPGSAFIVGERRALRAGNEYRFFDKNGALDSYYAVEVVMLSGESHTFNLRAEYDAEMPARAAEYLKKEETIADGDNLYGQRNYPDVAAPQLAANPEQQRWVAAQPGLKFAVKSNGLYRVTRQQLSDAGFDVSVPTTNWQLYTDGVEQTMLVTGADAGGVLGANGHMEFYGFGFETAYTNARQFYLVVGTTPGKRMPTYEGRGKSVKVALPSFSNVAQCRSSDAADCNRARNYIFTVRNGETENFFGDVIFQNPANITVNAPFVDTSVAQAVVDVSIQGFSTNPPNHNITVALNGTTIGSLTGIGMEAMQASFSVPVSLLQDGANIVRFTPTVTNEVSLVDYVRIRYQRRYSTSNDRLLFPTAYQRAIRAQGFTNSNVRVFDVTDPSNTGLFNHQLVQEGSTYSALLSTSRPRMLYAVADNAVMTFTATAITPNAPSNLYNTAVDKDLFIVTYKDWMTQANQLAAYRSAQGLSVVVADVEDVFDEFSFGASTPFALRAFFQRTMPDYAILFGDGTVDAKSYVRPNNNFIPTMFADTAFGEVASDEIIADFTGANSAPDFVSDFPIGRLSARNAAMAQILVDKIINFEQTVTAGQTFSRGALFVCDDPIGYTFCQTNQLMAQRLPMGTPAQFTARNGTTSSTAQSVRDEIVARINQGPYIVGYAGHGSTTGWTDANLLRQQEINQLNNGTAGNNKLSMFIELTCLNGSFADPNLDSSLAESLVRAQNGGAVAVWASSGLTIADGQDAMAFHFYDLLRTSPNGTRIGELLKSSKIATFDNDVRSSWVWFGDPTLKVK